MIAPLLGGLVGTAVMTVFLFFPRWLNFGNVDVVRAVGVLMTGKEERAWVPGFAIHFASGIVFAYVYFGLLSLARLPVNLLTCSMAGAIHGVIVMLLVCIVVMEHHPMQKYHERGPMTGFMQLVAHVLYGATVGWVIQTVTVA